MSDFYTPPPFEVCGRCNDGLVWLHHLSDTGEHIGKDKVPCPACNGTGRIPIYYTIPQWEELTGRKVPDDMPVWLAIHNVEKKRCSASFHLHKPDWTYMPEWALIGCNIYKIIATEAGRPPKDWRPK